MTKLGYIISIALLFFSYQTKALEQCEIGKITLSNITTVLPAKGMDSASNFLVKQLFISAATAPIGFGMTAKFGMVKGFVASKPFSAAYGYVFDDSLNALTGAMDEEFSEQDDLIVRINGVKVVPSNFGLEYYPMYKDDVYPFEVSGTYMNYADVQLIEYDSGSDNDDLGSFWVQDETNLEGALAPFNQDTQFVYADAEDGSVYKFDWKLEPGLGQLEDLAERVLCSYDECVDAREPIPNVFDLDVFDWFADDGELTCPRGYIPSTYGLEDFDIAPDPQPILVCELLPHLAFEGEAKPCGADFVSPSDPYYELNDGDVVVFQNKHLPNKIGNQYVSSPYDGQYLANCKNCAITVGAIDTAYVHVLDPNRSAAQWVVKKIPGPDGHTFAFMGDNGKYLARCDGCLIGGPSSHATVHVVDPTTEPAAQFSFANRVADTVNNEFAWTLSSSNGALLRAVPLTIIGQKDVNNTEIRASASFVPIGNYGEEMWQIKRLSNLANGTLPSEIFTDRATVRKTVYTIGAGQTVTIDEGVTLTISNGSKVINQGTLINNGTLIIDDLGQLNNDGTYSTTIIINNGFIKNNGGVIINDNVIDNSQSKYLSNTGTIHNNKFIYDPFNSRYFGNQPRNNPRNSGYYFGYGLHAERACMRLNGSLVGTSCTIKELHLQEGQSLIIASGYNLIITGGVFNEGEITNAGAIDLSQGVIHQCGTLIGNGQIVNQTNLKSCVVYEEQTKCEDYGGSFVPGASANTGTCNSPTVAVQYDAVLTIPTGVTWNISGQVEEFRFDNFGTINIEAGGTMNLNGAGYMLNDGQIYNYGTFMVGADDSFGIGFEFDSSAAGYFTNHGAFIHTGNLIFSYTAETGSGYENFTFECDGTYENVQNAQLPEEHFYFRPCDPTDSDNDGVDDVLDDLPLDPNESVDSDGDGVADSTDLFPNNAEEWADTDGDCEGFNTETAGEGCGDNSDLFPLNPNEMKDYDGDCGDLSQITQTVETGNGCGDNSDAFKYNGSETVDSDGDGIGDNRDAFPFDDTETRDTDKDTVGDNTDPYPNDYENTRLISRQTGYDVVYALFSSDSRGDIIPPGLPGDLVMNWGMIKFKLDPGDGSPGATSTVTLTYPSEINPEAVWFNYGPTISNPEPHWYQDDSMVIEGNTISFSVTDGALGDADMEENAIVSVVGGPAVSEDSIDDDNDGMSNAYEIANGLNLLEDDSAGDADQDGLTNLQEYIAGTSSTSSDTDGDGLSDYAEIITHGTNPILSDSDNDGMPDDYEIANGLNPLINDANLDLDNDGLTNLIELQNNTNPRKRDTDNDGMDDGYELANGYNPLVQDTPSWLFGSNKVWLLKAILDKRLKDAA